MASGSTVEIVDGIFAEMGLGKDGITYHFHTGSGMSAPINADMNRPFFFTDTTLNATTRLSHAPINIRVTGSGTFARTGPDTTFNKTPQGCFGFTDPGTMFYIEANSITDTVGNNFEDPIAGVFMCNGTGEIHCPTWQSTYWGAIIWNGGNLTVYANTMAVTNAGSISHMAQITSQRRAWLPADNSDRQPGNWTATFNVTTSITGLRWAAVEHAPAWADGDTTSTQAMIINCPSITGDINAISAHPSSTNGDTMVVNTTTAGLHAAPTAVYDQGPQGGITTSADLATPAAYANLVVNATTITGGQYRTIYANHTAGSLTVNATTIQPPTTALPALRTEASSATTTIAGASITTSNLFIIAQFAGGILNLNNCTFNSSTDAARATLSYTADDLHPPGNNLTLNSTALIPNAAKQRIGASSPHVVNWSGTTDHTTPCTNITFDP